MTTFYLGYDVESGGLIPEESDLLTAYFCIMDESYNILEELSLQLKPDGQRLPVAEAGALKINGINIQNHLADPDTITYSEGKTKLVTLINKYLKKFRGKSNITPFGYNILGFDNAWIQHHLLPKSEFNNLLHYKCCDVMTEVDFLKLCTYLPSTIGSLVTVNDYLGLPSRSAHEARNDVLMTIAVHKKLLELMSSKKEGGQTVDLISLLEAE